VSPIIVLVGIRMLSLFLGMLIDRIGKCCWGPHSAANDHTAWHRSDRVRHVVVCMVEIGVMTPAVGLNVYVLKGAARNVSIADIRDCGRFGWFVFVDTINAALLLAVAQISLFAPQSTIKEGPLCRAQPARPA
jgi:C4-dicarboxylate transporter, DctM subunit